MVISKFDLMLFSPHRKGVGFRGDYENYEKYLKNININNDYYIYSNTKLIAMFNKSIDMT